MPEHPLDQEEAQIKAELKSLLYQSLRAIELRTRLRQIQLTKEDQCRD